MTKMRILTRVSIDTGVAGPAGGYAIYSILRTGDFLPVAAKALVLGLAVASAVGFGLTIDLLLKALFESSAANMDASKLVRI